MLWRNGQNDLCAKNLHKNIDEACLGGMFQQFERVYSVKVERDEQGVSR